MGELGSAGFLGVHIQGYGCAGAGAASYGLVCLELGAADSGWRTFVSVQGSLAMSAIAKYGSDAQKQQWLPVALTPFSGHWVMRLLESPQSRLSIASRRPRA